MHHESIINCFPRLLEHLKKTFNKLKEDITINNLENKYISENQLSAPFVRH